MNKGSTPFPISLSCGVPFVFPYQIVVPGGRRIREVTDTVRRESSRCHGSMILPPLTVMV